MFTMDATDAIPYVSVTVSTEADVSTRAVAPVRCASSYAHTTSKHPRGGAVNMECSYVSK